MKIFVTNHTQISEDLTSVCLWIEIADKHLPFLLTKHLQCIKTSIIFFPVVILVISILSILCCVCGCIAKCVSDDEEDSNQQNQQLQEVRLT